MLFLGYDIDVTPLWVFLTLVVVYIVTYVVSNYKRFQYWPSQGVPQINPWLTHFRILSFFRMKGPDLGEIHLKVIKELGTIYGNNEIHRNSLLVADVDALKDMLVRDFSHFMDRQDFNRGHIVGKFLTAAQGHEWKALRSVISPTFTSGKMKAMFPLMKSSLETMLSVIQRKSAAGEEIDAVKMYGDFTMDVIAKCAFAVETNTNDDPNHMFVVNAKKIFQFPKKFLFFIFLPQRLLRLIGFNFFQKAAFNYLVDLSQHMINERRKKGTDITATGKRNYVDFLQLMLEAHKEETDENENGHDSTSKSRKSLTDEEIIANIILILLAGYHTTSMTLAFCSWLLAKHPDAQNKLRSEVIEAMKQNDGKLDYENIMSLPYLDAVIHETLRMFPPVTQVERQCSQDYVLKLDGHETLGNKEINIPKGTGIIVPIYAVHYMDKYYPKPKLFTPERFLSSNKMALNPYAFLSFVTGPRNWVGMRFALLEAKMAIANVIAKYEIKPTDKVKDNLEYGPSPVLLQPRECPLIYEPIYTKCAN